MADVQNRNWLLIVLILAALYLLSAIFANITTVFEPSASTSNGNVAVIPVKGTLLGEPQSSGLSQSLDSQDIVDMIEKADNDDAIEAIILEVNSPGGSAVASEEIARAVEDTNKTVVAWIREVGASGGYWVASEAEHIVASPVSITGSIGVISSYLDYAGLIEDYNVTYNRLVAGEYKDMGTPWKELTDEEERIFQGKLDIMYDYFVETVAENRNKTVEATEELAQGLIYTGEEAVQNGLIDELGSEDEVHAYIEDKHNITVDTVTYKQQRTFLSLLGGVFERHGYAMGEGVASELSSERQTTPIRT